MSATTPNESKGVVTDFPPKPRNLICTNEYCPCWLVFYTIHHRTSKRRFWHHPTESTPCIYCEYTDNAIEYISQDYRHQDCHYGTICCDSQGIRYVSDSNQWRKAQTCSEKTCFCRKFSFQVTDVDWRCKQDQECTCYIIEEVWDDPSPAVPDYIGLDLDLKLVDCEHLAKPPQKGDRSTFQHLDLSNGMARPGLTLAATRLVSYLID